MDQVLIDRLNELTSMWITNLNMGDWDIDIKYENDINQSMHSTNWARKTSVITFCLGDVPKKPGSQEIYVVEMLVNVLFDIIDFNEDNPMDYMANQLARTLINVRDMAMMRKESTSTVENL